MRSSQPTVRILYYDHNRPEQDQAPFRHGEAGTIWLDGEGLPDSRRRLTIFPNALHALWEHGEVDALRKNGIAGLEPGIETLIPPGSIDDVAAVFRRADRRTYGARYEFLIGKGSDPEPTEYRLAVNNREYQRALAQLHFLCTSSSREGHGVYLVL